MVFGAGPYEDPISPACARGGHQECGHVRVGLRFPVSADRLQSRIVLCGCDCHASCPLAGRAPVALTVWQQLCACSGGAKHRAWSEDAREPWPGAADAWEKSRRETVLRRSARREAFRAAHAAAHGKSRAQVLDLYRAELQARDQELPAEPFLGAQLDLLTGHWLRAIWNVEKLRWTSG